MHNLIKKTHIGLKQKIVFFYYRNYSKVAFCKSSSLFYSYSKKHFMECFFGQIFLNNQTLYLRIRKKGMEKIFSNYILTHIWMFYISLNFHNGHSFFSSHFHLPFFSSSTFLHLLFCNKINREELS